MVVQKTGQTVCHVYIRKVAKELCAETYEEVMSSNEIRDRWKKQNEGCTEKQLLNRFVERNWPRFIEGARTTLGLMLRGDYPDDWKESIMDILEKDQFLRNRTQPHQIH